MKIHYIVLALLAFVEFAHSSKNDIRLEIVKNLLEDKTDSALSLLSQAFIESKQYGENPFTPFEVIAINTISGNYSFVLNIDSLNYYKSKEYTLLVSVPNDGLYLNMENLFVNYIHSEKHKSLLKSFVTSDQIFLNTFLLSLDRVSQSEVNDYILNNQALITNEAQKIYLQKNVWFKKGPTALKFYIDMGGGADNFINGAESVLRNTGHLDMGFRLCIYSICPEYEMQIVNSKSKLNIEQNGYIFPKEAGPQMVISKINVGYQTFESTHFENVIYGGLALTPFDIAENPAKDYNIDQEMNGFSVGYNIGTSLDAYLKPIQTGRDEMSTLGIRCRVGYLQLKEKQIMNLNGGDLYWSIQLAIKIYSLKSVELK